MLKPKARFDMDRRSSSLIISCFLSVLRWRNAEAGLWAFGQGISWGTPCHIMLPCGPLVASRGQGTLLQRFGVLWSSLAAPQRGKRKQTKANESKRKQTKGNESKTTCLLMPFVFFCYQMLWQSSDGSMSSSIPGFVPGFFGADPFMFCSWGCGSVRTAWRGTS